MSPALRLAAAALLVVTACGGGGGGGGGGGPTVPTARFSFTQAAGGGAGSLGLTSGAGSTLTTLRLELVATQVADLYAVAFDLTYPTAVMHFAGAAEGTFLSAGGTVQTTFQAVETEPGRLVVGISRLGAAPGVAGSGTVALFEFTAAAPGSGGLAFAGAHGYDAAGRELADIHFVAGSVEYVP